jgi:hypothetical protein
LSLIAFITAETTWIDYDYSTNTAVYKHDKKAKIKTIAPEFSSSYPYYVKVEVAPEEGTPTPLICFSPTDANCKSDRQAFAKIHKESQHSFLLREINFKQPEKNYILM